MQENNTFNSEPKPTPTEFNQVELSSTKFNLVQPGSTKSNSPRPTPTDPNLVRSPHWLTLDKVEKIFKEQGIPRTRVLLGRYCRQGRLRGIKDEGRNGEEWYVDPDSIPTAIAELKRINGVNNEESDPDSTPTNLDQPKLEPQPTPIETPAKDPEPENKPQTKEPEPKPKAKRDLDSDPNQPKPTPTAVEDIESHPLVRHLKGEVLELKTEVKHWQSEYKDQVKTTETIQQRANDQLIELQKLVHVGNSSILADFFLRAKQLIGLAPDADLPETEDVQDNNPRKKAKKIQNDA